MFFFSLEHSIYGQDLCHQAVSVREFLNNRVNIFFTQELIYTRNETYLVSILLNLRIPFPAENLYQYKMFLAFLFRMRCKHK